MSRFKKTNVQMHRESYGGVHPAVNVKVHGYNTALIDDVIARWPECTDDQAEKALVFAFDAQCRDFWDYWCDTTGDYENGLYGSPEYAYFPNHTVRVECEGRSGGWLVIHCLPDVEDWDAVLVSQWAKFQKDVLADVEFRMAKDVLLDGIEANNWYLPYAQEYNFHDGANKGEHICIAEARADIKAYAAQKWGVAAAGSILGY